MKTHYKYQYLRVQSIKCTLRVCCIGKLNEMMHCTSLIEKGITISVVKLNVAATMVILLVTIWTLIVLVAGTATPGL